MTLLRKKVIVSTKGMIIILHKDVVWFMRYHLFMEGQCKWEAKYKKMRHMKYFNCICYKKTSNIVNIIPHYFLWKYGHLKISNFPFNKVEVPPMWHVIPDVSVYPFDLSYSLPQQPISSLPCTYSKWGHDPLACNERAEAITDHE